VKGLNTRTGLKDISFSVRKGEILGIGGLQGHGQIDLLNTLFGIHRIVSGSILINGEKIRLRNTAQAIHKGLLLVPQERKTEGLFIEDTIGNNLIACALNKISFWGIIRGKLKSKMRKDIAARMNIKFSNWLQDIKYLSGGNQQKVALGRWFAQDAKVFMLIEPTRGIDVNTKSEIYQHLKNLVNNGYSIIITSNELLELVGVCDRVLVMYENRIISQLVNSEITEENIVAASFGERLGEYNL
jgi:ABC-type sugar transport system ATPase subunit